MLDTLTGLGGDAEEVGGGSSVERAEAPVSPRGSAPKLLDIRRCRPITSQEIFQHTHDHQHGDGGVCFVSLRMMSLVRGNQLSGSNFDRSQSPTNEDHRNTALEARADDQKATVELVNDY